MQVELFPDGPGAGAASDLRVLLTLPSLAPESGGPAATVSYLSRDLAAMGVTAGILVGKPDTGTQNVMTHVPVKDAVYRGRPNGTLESVVQGFFNGRPPNLIHDNGMWLALNHRVAALGRRLAIPRIVSPRGMLEPWPMQHKAWKKKLAWRAYQRRDVEAAALIHATAPAEAENLRRLGLTRPIAVIPNGVELPSADTPKLKEIRSSASRFALFLSRIHPKKGLLNLIEAWGSARPADWELIIAGPDQGGHRKEIEEAVRRAGLEDAIRFIGPVYGREKNNLFRMADLFILPSFSENFGLVVGEALAWRVPVITTKGAPWEVLETERCGWWVDIGVEPLAEAIRDSTGLTDEERRAMGSRGRELMERKFSWPHIAKQVLAVYRWVLGGEGRPEFVRLD